LLIFNTGYQAPNFKEGFTACTVVGFVQVGGVAGMWWLSGRGVAMHMDEEREDTAAEIHAVGGAKP
jgi:hypothetical protein